MLVILSPPTTPNRLFHVPLRKLAMVLTQIKPKIVVLVAMVTANEPWVCNLHNHYLQRSIKIIFFVVIKQT